MKIGRMTSLKTCLNFRQVLAFFNVYEYYISIYNYLMTSTLVGGVSLSRSGRFRLYDISALRGKVPSIFMDNYYEDSQNVELLSLIAGLHRSFGDFDLGIKISEDIADKVPMGEDNMRETSIAVWNLYILSKIYIEQEKFDKAYRALDIAERYWSKDLILADSTGMCRLKNKEDLWIRRAFGYLIQGRKNDFESMVDRIILSRYELYGKAHEVTKETPVRDIYLLDCFEYSSYMCRNLEEIKHALIFIKTALRYLGKIPINNDYLEGKRFERAGDLKNAYTCYLKFYLENRPQFFSDTIAFGTCKCCIYFNPTGNLEGECKSRGIKVDQSKGCSKFSANPI